MITLLRNDSETDRNASARGIGDGGRSGKGRWTTKRKKTEIQDTKMAEDEEHNPKILKKERRKKSSSNGWPVRKLLLITDRHGQDHTGKRSRFLSVRLLALTIWLSLFFLFSASFYHVSSLQFFWFCLVWFGSVSLFFAVVSLPLSRHTVFSKKKKKKWKERNIHHGVSAVKTFRVLRARTNIAHL